MATAEALVNRSTKTAIEYYVKQPSMPLLVVGGPGSGKEAVAEAVSSSLLALSRSSLALSPNYQLVDGNDGEGIDAVRGAIKRLSLRNVSKSGGLRVLHIKEADRLGLEAQNTLLKTLEEPSAGTVIILSCESENRLLPTIVSRCVTLAAHPVSLEDSLAHYRGDYSEAEIKSAWSLSGGYAGLLDSLLKTGNQHPLKIAVGQAKQLLTLPTFARLIFVENNASSRDDLKILLTGLNRVLGSAHKTLLASGRNDKNKILNNRKLVNSLLADLDSNANAKLAGLKLALNLKV